MFVFFVFVCVFPCAGARQKKTTNHQKILVVGFLVSVQVPMCHYFIGTVQAAFTSDRSDWDLILSTKRQIAKSQNKSENKQLHEPHLPDLRWKVKSSKN